VHRVTLYWLLGMAIVAAVAGGYGAWEHKGKLAAEAETQACAAKLEAQNQAVLALKAEGDRRIAAAQKGLKAASEQGQAARSEAERLRGLVSGATPPGACPAGAAVSELRRGLK